MKYRDWTREMRSRTAPREAGIGRVRERLDRQLAPATAELSHLPEPTELAAARVRARLRSRPRRQVPVWASAATVGVVAAALALLTVVMPRPDAPVAVTLSGAGDEVVLTEHVRAWHDGRGAVAGTERDLVIDWEVGRIELEVDPDEGVALEVRTPEGTVSVVGTRFAVVRDATGTSIEVEHGAVRADCGATGESDPSGRPAAVLGFVVAAGERAECLPVTASGWLARARAEEGRSAPASTVLARADAGLRLDAPAPIASELEVARMGALLRDGRSSEALDASERALAGADAARAQELHRAAARLALAAGDCDRALPHLDALDALAPDEAAYRARCSASR